MDSELNEFTKIINLINELLITDDETKYTKIIEYLELKNLFQKDLLNHLLSLTDCNVKFRLLGFYYKNLKLYSDSMEWYMKGVKLNNAICVSNIAEYYANGYGVEKDYKIALEWFKKGAELNDVNCFHNISMFYTNGDGVEKDYKIALKWLKRGAELNNVKCINSIGVYYTNGYGVEKDYKIALEWIKKGVELNNTTSIHNVGVFYFHGYGVEKDYKIALEWFKKGVELNHVMSIHCIGIIYANGYGVEQDYKIALEWYKKGAELNHNKCINNIGLFYENGCGVEKNYDIAIEWYTKGVEQEHEACIKNFIRLFKSDHKIEQTAIENYKNKINIDIISNYKLGLIYEQQENTIEALKCFAKIIKIAKSVTWKDIAQNKISKISVNISGKIGIKIALYMLDLSEENNIFRKENDDLRTEILYRPDGVEYMKAHNSFIDNANIIKS